MTLVNLKTILDPAYRQGYAVGAFNVINLEFLEAILETAEQKKSPVILNIAEVHFPFVKIENIVPAIQAMAERSPVDMALNLDHGLSDAAIDRCLAAGFTSIMYDGSGLAYGENLERTCRVVEKCHPLGVSVEAELGAVGGAEGGGLVGDSDPSLYTDVGQARDFVNRTGIDALAVAIGNVHGAYRGEPALDFERLTTIREAVGIPLVLHGGSGLSAADFRRAIGLGIAKINFFTGMAGAALGATRAYLENEGQRYNDYPLLLQEVKNEVARVVGEQMEIFGSSGRAEAG